MRKIMTLALLAVGLVVLTANPAQAAPVEAVVAACDKMDAEKPGSCSYTVDSGGLHGCTKNGCFTCPVDGSRQCHAMRTSGKRSHVEIGSVQMKCEPVINGWCKQALEPEPPAKSAGR
ncbi:hypothetical protein [Lysobacter solisilvae (ex Woo and Kim 2020)]|uniref:DUF2282 domain-containing protein n=1 Tax=Agrilutibacter terrestris TaxID=2865112 RepID=A0A7H0G0A5_9GAMM|nr:hypothetical protein [Lysobacter terrestris]QNP41721.1 hypothetical protein H8B22_05800 [Lysobacter terrestris]